MRKYHTVIVRTRDCDEWHIHFGDYDKEVAKQERLDITYGDPDILDATVITTNDDQASIDERVRELNEKI